jgi:hypothetical protein
MLAILRGYGTWLALLAGLFVVGCHKDKTTTRQAKTDDKTTKDSQKAKGGIPRKIDETKVRNDLAQLALAYHNCNDTQGRPPANADELAPYFENDTKLKEALKSGQYVVIWKSRFTSMTDGTSNTILVYEGWEDTEGNRFVAMADTKVKKLTAKEFEATPKAQGR